MAEAYYDTPRLDLLEWADVSGKRVIDIGCGAGANAAWLREHGAEWIEGVEPHSPSADVAEGRLDHVHRCGIEAARIEGQFDLVICADVLEHLVDPGAVLIGLREHAASGSRLVVSAPNVRHYRALARIAFGAGFRPDPDGTFDGTHLRFFTRSNLADLLAAAGWRPQRWGYPTWSWAGRTVRPALSRLTFGRSDEWLVGEWFVLAGSD